jgi:hypothetical protein
LLDSPLAEEEEDSAPVLDDSLEAALPVEVPDALEPLDSTVFVVDAAELLVDSAGSCPEASCTYTTRNATLNSAAARLTTVRRMRRARTRMAVRLMRASVLPSSCEPASASLGTGGDVRLWSMFAPIWMFGWLQWQCRMGVSE